MSEPFTKLAAKLSELFELEKADLDFGIHRIIKARQKHIRIFLGLDPPPADDPHAPTLRKIVRREMGELNTTELERQLAATTEKSPTTTASSPSRQEAPSPTARPRNPRTARPG